MEFNFDLNLIQSQKLLLTPQLKQALEVLRMNSQELLEYVQEQLEENPAIEIDEIGDSPHVDDFIVPVGHMEWGSVLSDRIGTNDNDEESPYDINDFTVDKSTIRLSLKEHLLFQLHTSNLDERQTLIGEYLIDNTDENGYLTITISEVAGFFNISSLKVFRVLERIQGFDPPGICARNLKDCLLIQLRQMKDVDPNVIKVIEYHLDDIASNRVAFVAKSLGVDTQKMGEILTFIKTLEPKPGRAFAVNDEIKYIVPDIIIKKINNKFEVLINDDSIPLINVNEYYRKIIEGDISSDTRKFIQNKIDSAVWLIRCIEQRKCTVRKVAECILRRQLEFFEKGKKHIKPLTMKTVAKESGLHESTISRTVNGKYIQCSWGIFEMRYFFTGRISASDGEALSTENIKLKIKSIIKAEDKRKPLSDSEIADLLKKEGAEISRRTVAKYRAELGIEVTGRRKKY